MLFHILNYIFFRLEHISDDDLLKCEEFVEVMQILYTSTLAVSSDKVATSSQIIPILLKLESHFKVKEDDSAFVSNVKRTVWDNLVTRYQVNVIILNGPSNSD